MINCSVDQIYDFSNEITRAIDYCHFNMSGFDEIFRLIEDKCNTLRLAGDNAFSQVNNSISKANYAITVNKREISSGFFAEHSTCLGQHKSSQTFCASSLQRRLCLLDRRSSFNPTRIVRARGLNCLT